MEECGLSGGMSYFLQNNHKEDYVARWENVHHVTLTDESNLLITCVPLTTINQANILKDEVRKGQEIKEFAFLGY